MNLHTTPTPLLLTALAILGATVGRFLSVCIDRFPQHDLLRDQLRSLPSRWNVCQRCSAIPSLRERIPVVGWLTSRRCQQCGSRLSLQLPIVEITTAILFAAVYWCEITRGGGTASSIGGLVSVEGPQGPEVLSLWSPMVWLHLRYALHMIMICGLVVATGIDLKFRIIPDGCTVPIAVVAVLASVACGQLYVVPIWFQDASTVKTLQPLMHEILQPLFVPWDPTSFIRAYPHLHGLLVSLLGVLAGAGSVWLVRQIGFLILKQEAMGFGDVVLMGMIGSVIGWQPVLAVFILAPTLAIFAAAINWFAHRDNEIPYGPFLSGATVLLLLTWPHTWPFAKRFFDMGPFLIVMAVFMVILLAASLQVVQIGKRLFGFGNSLPVDDGGWTSADHLFYYNGERPDEQAGQWKRDQWSGSRAGRAMQQQHVWKD
ncbi:MAG: A24 family peptidase [Fuerstiella sp.]|nr:A24 family peptidase [Fuerstiella sp.]